VIAPRVTVFGAVAMDTRLASRAALVPATSNPVAASERPGGVGRNLAMTLAGLGATVTLASRIGADATGDALLAALAAGGIDTHAVTRSTIHPTARYWAVLESTGELALGLADMAVLDELEPVAIEPAMAAPADAWLVDCNLPTACIAHLLRSPRRPPLVAVDTVSTAKVPRIAADLARIDLLCTNAAEAGVLTGDGPREVLAARLLAMGTGRVVMGLGAAGLVLADELGVERLAALPIAPRDVTGAGDALAAAVLFGLLAGLDLRVAARIGRLAAAAAIAKNAPVARGIDIAGLRHLARRYDWEADAELARLQP
jgi:pseudouridine kinase